MKNSYKILTMIVVVVVLAAITWETFATKDRPAHRAGPPPPDKAAAMPVEVIKGSLFAIQAGIRAGSDSKGDYVCNEVGTLCQVDYKGNSVCSEVGIRCQHADKEKSLCKEGWHAAWAYSSQTASPPDVEPSPPFERTPPIRAMLLKTCKRKPGWIPLRT